MIYKPLSCNKDLEKRPFILVHSSIPANIKPGLLYISSLGRDFPSLHYGPFHFPSYIR